MSIDWDLGMQVAGRVIQNNNAEIREERKGVNKSKQTEDVILNIQTLNIYSRHARAQKKQCIFTSRAAAESNSTVGSSSPSSSS